MKTSINNLMAVTLLAVALVVPTPAQTLPVAYGSGRPPMGVAPSATSAAAGVSAPVPGSYLETPKVFLVPGLAGETRDMQELIADLHVMCRIFDKKLNPQMPTRTFRSEAAELLAAMTPMGARTGATEALYLDGFGIVFFVNAGFPLVLAEGDPQQGTDQPPEDPLWQRVREEVVQGNPTTVQDVDARETDRRNREATAILTDTVIQTLKHAANIRSLQPDQNFVIRVAGLDEATSRHPYSRRSRQPYGGLYSDPFGTYGSVASPVDEPVPETTLIIRATKAAVDDFSSGKLSVEQFKARVELTTIGPPNSGSATPAAPETDAMK